MSRLKTRTGLNTLTMLTIVAVMSFFSYSACTGSGDTDGGPGNDDAGLGSQPVSDGGFGASLTIRLKDAEELHTAERTSFFVDALDPNGLPLAFRRVFCESEKGIAIIEPSNGGVAFEHTGPDGSMSGVLGGLTPGSFLLECRLEEGFNLVARRRIKVVGEVPDDFAGFPGAAGGNLGGGVLIEAPETVGVEGDTRITGVNFINSAGTGLGSDGPIDTTRDICGPGEFETFGPDQVQFAVQNAEDEPVVFTEVSFTVANGGTTLASSSQNINGEIASGSSASLSVAFTELSGTIGGQAKIFAGTSKEIDSTTNGTRSVQFVLSGETLSGDSVTATATVSVNFVNVNGCD